MTNTGKLRALVRAYLKSGPKAQRYSEIDPEVAALLDIELAPRAGVHDFALALLPRGAEHEARSDADGAHARVWIGDREWTATTDDLDTEDVMRAAALSARIDLMLAGELG